MWLMRIIRPDVIPSRKSDWNWRVRLFHWTLVRLLPVYKRSAVSDAINIGETQIIHNVRDYWYEQELQRFRIDTAQHFEKRPVPYHLKSKCRRSSLFRWSESLLVFHDGRSYNIKHTSYFSVETDINGVLRISSKNDCVLRSEFTARTNKSQKSQDDACSEIKNTQPASVSKPDKGSRQKITIKDSVPRTDISAKQQNETTKYQGFEENNIF